MNRWSESYENLYMSVGVMEDYKLRDLRASHKNVANSDKLFLKNKMGQNSALEAAILRAMSSARTDPRTLHTTLSCVYCILSEFDWSIPFLTYRDKAHIYSLSEIA
jgi:hypothetical protein